MKSSRIKPRKEWQPQQLQLELDEPPFIEEIKKEKEEHQ